MKNKSELNQIVSGFILLNKPDLGPSRLIKNAKNGTVGIQTPVLTLLPTMLPVEEASTQQLLFTIMHFHTLMIVGLIKSGTR